MPSSGPRVTPPFTTQGPPFISWNSPQELSLNPGIYFQGLTCPGVHRYLPWGCPVPIKVPLQNKYEDLFGTLQLALYALWVTHPWPSASCLWHSSNLLSNCTVPVFPLPPAVETSHCLVTQYYLSGKLTVAGTTGGKRAYALRTWRCVPLIIPVWTWV